MVTIDAIEKDVKKLSEEIDKTKIDLSEDRGQIKALMARLKETYGFNTTEEAKADLEEAEKENERLGNEIREEYEALNAQISSQE